MAGFMIRPKDTNMAKDGDKGYINAESIEPSNEGYEAEYTDGTGVASHKRRNPGDASEAPK